MRLASTAALLLAATAPVLAQTPIVQTVISNGTTQTRYDMVILGDGYKSTEQTKFDQDVLTFLTALFQTQPYQTFAAYFNVHTVFRASIDSGADEPDITPPVFVDTAYDCTYNTGGTARCLYIGDTALGLADAALAPANEGRVLVMVNSNRYGGCAGTFAVSYTGGSMSDVQIHELGHSLGLLADEYDYPNDTYTGSEPSQANATIAPAGTKWTHWHGTDGISAFEGARYYLHGLWRPRNNCMMRSLGQSLCSVCKEQISKVTNSITKTIVASSPASPTVTVSVPVPQLFSITHIVPPGNAPTITWSLDGVPIPGATSANYTLNPTSTTLGSHTLSVSLRDNTTMVRNDPANTMIETVSWQVTVDDPNAFNLRSPAFTLNPVFVSPGSSVTLSPTITNDGPGTAGAFDVEFFLTTSNVWSPQDIYLGKVVVPGLGSGQSTVATQTVQLPWRLSAQSWFVHMVIDRGNAIVEPNEADNTRFAVVLCGNGACGTKLEFGDPLLYPHDNAAVSVTSGGAVHPVVVTRCQNTATSLYLILWGASGTSPGLQLTPTTFLPLNLDGFTNLGLSLANTPVFGGFLGILDSQGQAHATFALPPSTGLPSVQTHFAYLLANDVELFAAASNPIGLLLLP